MERIGMDRRALLRGAGMAAGAGALAAWLPAWAQPVSAGAVPQLTELSGEDIHLRIGHQMLDLGGRPAHAIGINGTIPAPLLRLREGQQLRVHVENLLDEETSLHWHGLILPFQMDGVPGVSFPGIAPRARFTYEFPIVQSGTYWYHSHSGFQEQMGLYGPIVIAPAGPDRVAADREHVIVLADHGRMHPHAMFRKLKQQPGYFNRQQQTLAGLLAGRDQRAGERLAWGAMRMDPTDIADVTGTAYRYLINGHGGEAPWTALFAPGERVRLRFVNAAGMTIFNVRIPGLLLRIVAADGQDVHPVPVEEFQIAPGETYDAIVEPQAARAYAIAAETINRSGMALAMLAPQPGMRADPPPLRRRPVATMKDMGMDMGGMDMAGMDHGTGHGEHGGAQGASHAGHAGGMGMRDPANAPQVLLGPGVQTIAPMPVDRTGEPGTGLGDAGHRVLVYRDLMAIDRNPDVRAPARSIEVHLTGNMERYMWSIDGQTLSEAGTPIAIREGERVRVTLVNDTMMNHPIHLHGHFFELVTGHGAHSPRKHTVNVAPGGKVSWDVTGIAGDWAFHCHMLFHMHAGMMRIVQVRADEGAGA